MHDRRKIIKNNATQRKRGVTDSRVTVGVEDHIDSSNSLQLRHGTSKQDRTSGHHNNAIILHVPVANSLMNMGLSKGKESMTDWAGPNIEEISKNVTAP